MQLLISLFGKESFNNIFITIIRQLFMNRIVLPKCATDMVASALSFTAVVAALQQEPSELRRKFMNTNGAINFNLLFPCCIE